MTDLLDIEDLAEAEGLELFRHPESGVFITDGWRTDSVVFYDHRPGWACDGVFFISRDEVPGDILRELDGLADAHFAEVNNCQN